MVFPPFVPAGGEVVYEDVLQIQGPVWQKALSS